MLFHPPIAFTGAMILQLDRVSGHNDEIIRFFRFTPSLIRRLVSFIGVQLYI